MYGDVEIHNVEDREERNEPIIDETDIIEPVVIEQQKNNKRLVYKKRNDSN